MQTSCNPSYGWWLVYAIILSITSNSQAQFQENWDLAGAIDDARLLMQVGLELADQPEMPKWNPGDEFEAARKQAIATRPK